VKPSVAENFDCYRFASTDQQVIFSENRFPLFAITPYGEIVLY